jgi:DNA polymerase
MSFITLDFETYYAQDYTLSKLTTEEYINKTKFEVIGVGVKVDDAPAVWFSGSREETKSFLMQFDWAESALLCHNTMFDGAILAWKFNIRPAFYFDTLCMARSIHGVDAGGSLKALAERYELGAKGTEVEDAKGKKRKNFTPEDLAQYGEYCKNDVDLTKALFRELASNYPPEEFSLIDMTLRMFIDPVLEVDDAMLEDRLNEVRQEKLAMLGTLMDKLKCDTEEAVRKKLASNKQFAELLQEYGVEPPMKLSKTTGKETFALAKNDEGFISLTAHEDPFIQQLCAVRLGTKSTIEESRIERFIGVGARNRGRLPIPLKYYGAHTGRWSGVDKVNFQNLPSRDKKKKTLKNAIIAPFGHVVINCDSSQIEARVLAWLAGQDDLVKVFADGRDVYSVFATEIYKRPISKADPVERFVGKTCILGLGYGTGALKLQHTLKTTPPGVALEESDCKEIVDLYRKLNDKITTLWRDGDEALGKIAEWGQKTEPEWYGKHECVKIVQGGFLLPNGLKIQYPELQHIVEDNKYKYVYKSRKGQVSIWGGTVVENVIQALARIIVGQQMLEIQKRYKVVLTVHDAAVCVVPVEEVQEAIGYITQVMSIAPEWARGLPVACEAKYANSYGEC